MGRQWLHAKRLVAGLKKGRTTSKLVREIMVAAKMGGADPGMNARLFTAIEKAKKESVSKDVIDRAVKKGAGTGDEKLVMEHVTFEGKTPHGVPVIIECYTDNVNRTAPEMRKMFKEGVLGVSGANKFLFDHVGLVEAHHPDANADREGAAIEAGANEVETLTADQNDDIPEGACGARFICERTAVHTVAEWLKKNGWTVVTSEIGYVPKQFSELDDSQRAAVGEFLQQFEDHDDVHRVWAALK
jgi:YebC/PmpR family DNA-binding regulatory protein